MSVLQGMQSNSAVSQLWKIAGVQAQSGRKRTTGADRDGDHDGSPQISKAGQSFSQLSSLQSQNPDKFKQLLTDMASKLRDLAANTTDPAEQDKIVQMADRFTQAASTGDVSQLKPPSRHGHHHAAAAAAAGAGSEQDPTTLGVVAAGGGGVNSLGTSTQAQLKSLFDQFEQQLGGATTSLSAAA